jgi:hypothetical protein
MNTHHPQSPNSIQEHRTPLARATREALLNTPLAILVGWISPWLFGKQVSIVPVLCILVAIAAAEALVDEEVFPVDRELMLYSISLGIAVALIGGILLLWPGAF